MKVLKFRIGELVERRLDGHRETVYDVDEANRVIKTNWLDETAVMHFGAYTIPDQIAACPVLKIDRP